MRNTGVRRYRVRSRNRTRTLFFIIMALILIVIALSLSAQIINSAALMQIYIAASILAVGVIVIDMLGLLGSQHGDDVSGDDGGHDGGHDLGHDGAHDDGSFAWDEGSAHGAHDDDGDVASLHEVDHDSPLPGGGPVLEAIRYLRMFVYFCLGFGLVGVSVLASGRTAQASLLLAGVAGFGTVFLARTFYRLQPGDTGEVLSVQELLRENGTVTVPLTHEIMGKVRVQAGMEVHEVYALAAEEGEEFVRGDAVRIVEVSDKCMYVERV